MKIFGKQNRASMPKIDFPSYSLQAIIEKWQPIYAARPYSTTASAIAPQLGFKPLPNGALSAFLKSSLLYGVIRIVGKEGIEFNEQAARILNGSPNPEFLKNEIFIQIEAFSKIYHHFGSTLDNLPTHQEISQFLQIDLSLGQYSTTVIAKRYLENAAYVKTLRPKLPAKRHLSDKDNQVSIVFDHQLEMKELLSIITKLLECKN